MRNLYSVKRVVLNILHMFELMLSGSSDMLLKKHSTQYKHWFYNNIEDRHILELFESRGITWTDIKSYEEKGSFKEFLRYGAQLDSKMLKY